jgi:hypothetical protein
MPAHTHQSHIVITFRALIVIYILAREIYAQIIFYPSDVIGKTKNAVAEPARQYVESLRGNNRANTAHALRWFPECWHNRRAAHANLPRSLRLFVGLIRF